MDLTDSVENEWLCLKILKAFGIPVVHASMAVFEDVKALVVQRFDRRWADDRSWLIRLPQEDMCQALSIPPALKYQSDGGPGMEKIMTLLLGSAQAFPDRHLFLKTQFLFWLLGAIDGHAKNFSVFLMPGGRYSLTPVYDVMSAWRVTMMPVSRSSSFIAWVRAVISRLRVLGSTRVSQTWTSICDLSCFLTMKSTSCSLSVRETRLFWLWLCSAVFFVFFSYQRERVVENGCGCCRLWGENFAGFVGL